MKATLTFNIENHAFGNWHCANAPILQRFIRCLLRDVLPTLMMLVLVAWGAQIVTEKIDRAKEAHSPVVADIFAEKVYSSGFKLPANKCFDQRAKEPF